jgi:hypothetical protein
MAISQDCHKFAVDIVEKRCSAANVAVQVLTVTPYLCNLEADCSKLMGMFGKLCL